MENLKNIDLKMRNAGLSSAVVHSFRQKYLMLVRGDTGLIREQSIQPVADLPRLEQIAASPDPQRVTELMSQTVMIKLNNGLGTSMGLDAPKSMIKVKQDDNFLDFVVRQVLYLREKYHSTLRLLLMNSVRNSAEALAYLSKYPSLATGDLPLDFMQSAVPKLRTDNFTPVEWPENPALEWCPPGHGDVYAALLGSGMLDQIEQLGVQYLFISNGDNLGANLDPGLLAYFAERQLPFLMEVAERTAADVKGGHLARRAGSGELLLRELAQCPPNDEAAFQDITRHRFFNTNNIWVNVAALRKQLKLNGGVLPLPLIRNVKTVDPKNKYTPEVFQLETAMGAAIQLFAGAGAVVVPRRRFAPVKTTTDLLALRSDAYVINHDSTVTLAPERQGIPPKIELDATHYKIMAEFDKAFGQQVPSLRQARQLTIKGAISCEAGVEVVGTVTVENRHPQRRPWLPGRYQDTVVQL